MKHALGTRFLLAAGIVLAAAAVCGAAPVSPDEVWISPGFDESPDPDGQTLDYVKVGGVWYEPTGATCTECAAGDSFWATNEVPAGSRTGALSGLKFTQGVLNFGATGAKFDLGQTISNDDVRIVVAEIGTSVQTTGDPITVYPTLAGARVGAWQRALVAADYAQVEGVWICTIGSSGLTIHSFMTTLKRSDFTNDTGALTFDGIELDDTIGYDPHLVATLGDPEPAEAAPNVQAVTGMTFSPGFGPETPELDGQTLTGITTAEGTFTSLTGLTCTAESGTDWIDHAQNEAPASSTNEALSGLRFTWIGANPTWVKWSLGTTVSESDVRVRFFLGEIDATTAPAGPQLVTVWPLSGGSKIGTWRLDIQPGDYGPASPEWDSVRLAGNYECYMATFSLADFTNGPPIALSGVDGFQVDYYAVADANVFGTFTIIPPQGTVISIR
jgi:hypothetical protein